MKKFSQLALLLAGLGWLAEPCHTQSLEAHFRATFAARLVDVYLFGLKISKYETNDPPHPYFSCPLSTRSNLCSNRRKMGVLLPRAIALLDNLQIAEVGYSLLREFGFFVRVQQRFQQ